MTGRRRWHLEHPRAVNADPQRGQAGHDPVEHVAGEPIGLAVVMAKSWRASSGIREEIYTFAKARKPVVYLPVGLLVENFIAMLKGEIEPAPAPS